MEDKVEAVENVENVENVEGTSTRPPRMGSSKSGGESKLASFYKKTNDVPPFWKEKYKKNAGVYWDKFYRSNTTNFYKDRHWILREFEELLAADADIQREYKVLEVGSGVGNTLYPLLAETKHMKFNSFDFAATAIDLLKANPEFDAARCNAFVCDVTADELPSDLANDSGDFVFLIFVLSAIPPEKTLTVMKKLHSSLKSGGMVLFRDYAVNDMAEKRLADQKTKNKMGENFFVRADGTMAHYFTLEFMRPILEEVGFEIVQLEVVEREVTNHKLEFTMKRLFLQGKFKKK